MSHRITARFAAVALIAILGFAAPQTLASGLQDVAFEMPDFSALWQRITTALSPSADRVAIENDREIRDKQLGLIDPLGDNGAPPPSGAPLRVATERQPTPSARDRQGD